MSWTNTVRPITDVCRRAWSWLRISLSSADAIVALAPVVALPETLADFKGAEAGVIVAPVHLFWSGDREINLADDVDTSVWYTAVIGNGRPADQVERLNGARLVMVWPHMQMPFRTRMEWESRYPALRAARLAGQDRDLPAAA
jgi:hypothetical protein